MDIITDELRSFSLMLIIENLIARKFFIPYEDYLKFLRKIFIDLINLI